MQGITFDLPRDVTRIWDLEVPIIKDGTHVQAYVQDSIVTPSAYSELCYMLRAACEGDTFEIFLNTPGGVIDSAVMLVDAIKESKATVTARLSGTVASAGTIIALACDDLVVGENLAFMIHNYSGGMSGKGHEMKARQQFIDRYLNDAFATFYLGFLSEEEIDKVIEGSDMWFTSAEVKERWAAYKEAKETNNG